MKPEKVMQGTSRIKQMESCGLASNALVKYFNTLKTKG
jgi:hypothetical protein